MPFAPICIRIRDGADPCGSETGVEARGADSRFLLLLELLAETKLEVLRAGDGVDDPKLRAYGDVGISKDLGADSDFSAAAVNGAAALGQILLAIVWKLAVALRWLDAPLLAAACSHSVDFVCLGGCTHSEYSNLCFAQDPVRYRMLQLLSERLCYASRSSP